MSTYKNYFLALILDEKNMTTSGQLFEEPKTLPLLWSEGLVLRKTSEDEWTRLNIDNSRLALDLNLTNEVRSCIRTIEITNPDTTKIFNTLEEPDNPEEDAHNSFIRHIEEYEKYEKACEHHEAILQALLFAATPEHFWNSALLSPVVTESAFDLLLLMLSSSVKERAMVQLPRYTYLENLSNRYQQLSIDTQTNLRFIGEVLRSIYKTEDRRLRVMLLVWIMEMISARNPNTERFNVEDSISRQFILKNTVLLERYVSEKNEHYRREWYWPSHPLKCPLKGKPSCQDIFKALYDLRSIIAHGDWSRLKKYQDRDGKSEWNSFSNLYQLALMYTHTVIHSLFVHPELVTFIKEN